MDWMSFTMGLLTGFVTTVTLLAAVLMVYARPFFRAAKMQRETQDQVIKKWADQLAAAGKSPKWGSGNSG